MAKVLSTSTGTPAAAATTAAMSTWPSVGFCGVSSRTSPVSGRIAAATEPGSAQVTSMPEQAAGEQVIAAAVERPQRDDVAPLLAGGEQARGERGHARCERDAVLGPLELGQRPARSRRTVGL